MKLGARRRAVGRAREPGPSYALPPGPSRSSTAPGRRRLRRRLAAGVARRGRPGRRPGRRLRARRPGRDPGRRPPHLTAPPRTGPFHDDQGIRPFGDERVGFLDHRGRGGGCGRSGRGAGGPSWENRGMARRTATPPPEDYEERIVDIDVREEMQGSFLEYAYSVIYARALPDARDGLKPVHRRILFQMAEMGVRPERAHVKSARVVGEVMGKLHPHGDGAIYDALVRMAQPFSMRLPMVDGHGNFGSLGNDDPPAAMRYTECRLAAAAMLMTGSLDEDVVDFRPNYDGQEREPDVLPAALPHLLVNGASGIAVGMATNMPPHNLVEVVAAARHLIRHPRATLDDLMRFVPGPDLPTGGKIVGLEGIREAYESGRGVFRTRAAARIDNVTPRRKGIVVTELPYNVGPERVIEKISDLVKAKKLQGISDVKDLTDRSHGLRLVIEIKNGFHPEAVLEELYRLTPMEESFGINNVCLVDGQPRTLGPQGAPPGLPRPQARGRPPPQRLPPHARRGAPAPRPGPARRDPRHRRGHPAHPVQRRRSAGARAADERLRPHRRPDHLHPRHAAAPAHQVLPHRAGEGARRAGRHHRDPHGAARGRGPAAQDRLRRAGRGRQDPRHPATHRAAGVGRPARTRDRDDAGGGRRPVPRPAVLDRPARPHLRRDPAARPRARGPRTTRSSRLSRPPRAARSESSPRPVGSSACRSSTCPRSPAPLPRRRSPAGRPISEFLELDKDERPLAPVLARPPRRRARARHRAGRREAGRPPTTPPTATPSRSSGCATATGSSEPSTSSPAPRTWSSSRPTPSCSASAPTRYAPRAGRPAAWPASGSRPASGSSSSEPYPRRLPTPPSSSRSSGSSAALPGTEPGSIKVTPYAEYPAKGRGTGGVRAHRFLKGEDTLVLAWAGADAGSGRRGERGGDRAAAGRPGAATARAPRRVRSSPPSQDRSPRSAPPA